MQPGAQATVTQQNRVGSRADSGTRRRISRHIEHLGSADQKVASRAEGYLIRYGARALEPLMAACGGADPQVRYRAVWALGQIGDSRAFETILRLTDDSDKAVRYDAALALGCLGDSRGVAPLIDRMLCPDPEGSADCAAANGLVRLGAAALPSLIPLLASSDEATLCSVSRVLGGIGDEWAVEPIARLLTDEREDVRISAVEALADMGTETCLSLIAERLSDPSITVRRHAHYWHRELRDHPPRAE